MASGEPLLCVQNPNMRINTVIPVPCPELSPTDKQHAQTPSPRVLIHSLQPRHILTSTFSTYEATGTGLDGLIQTHLHLGALVPTGQPRCSGNKPLAWTFQVTTQRQEAVCLPVEENWRRSRIRLQRQVPSEGRCFSKFNPYKNHLNGHWKFGLLHLLYIPDSVALVKGSRNGISSDGGGGSCVAGTQGSKKPRLALHPTPPLPSPQDQHATSRGDSVLTCSCLKHRCWEHFPGSTPGKKGRGRQLLHPRLAHVLPCRGHGWGWSFTWPLLADKEGLWEADLSATRHRSGWSWKRRCWPSPQSIAPSVLPLITRPCRVTGLQATWWAPWPWWMKYAKSWLRSMPAQAASIPYSGPFWVGRRDCKVFFSFLLLATT